MALEPLNLKLTGSADGLSAALGKAHGDVSRFGGSVGGISSQFSGLTRFINPTTIALGAVAAAAAAAYKAVAEVREAMTRVDDLTDAANRLGVTFTELRGLRLSLGEATGLDDGAIDSAIAKLQVNLGQAAEEGSGKAFEALQRLGLSAGELLAAGPQRSIEMLAEKISQVEDKSLQLQLSFDILGKSGIAIAAALRESPGALEEAAKWARENLDLTEQQVNQVGSANDAWDRMTAAITHIFELIGAEVAPLIQLIAEDVTAFVGELGGAENATQGLTEAAAALYGMFRDIVELLSAPMRTALAAIEGDLTNIGNVWTDAFNFDGVGTSLGRFNEIKREAAERPPRQVSEAQVEMLDARGDAIASQAAATKATQEAADSVRDKANQVKAAVDSIRPRALAAITDRAEQLRMIGEREAKKSNDDLQKRLNDQVVGRLDRLIAAVGNDSSRPPINLD
jgi:hypothetical protein